MHTFKNTSIFSSKQTDSYSTWNVRFSFFCFIFLFFLFFKLEIVNPDIFNLSNETNSYDNQLRTSMIDTAFVLFRRFTLEKLICFSEANLWNSYFMFVDQYETENCVFWKILKVIHNRQCHKKENRVFVLPS